MNEKVFRKIIVAIDGSPNSYRAAEVAIEIADIYNSELIIVGVIDISMIADFEMKVGDEHTVQQAEKELKEGTLNNLKRVIDMAKEKKVIANISVRRGRPNLEIVNAANEFRVDLIVMGKGGRRGGSRLQMGNITERVIEDSDVSILVVK
jgi:nucleotide-binding universal stress UspA family protein